jgi:putative transcriptional regulator
VKSRFHRRKNLIHSFYWLNLSSPLSLKKLRERAGLRQCDVCRELDIADSTLRNWERGRKTIMMPLWELEDFLTKMQKLYKCSRAELIAAFAVSFAEGGNSSKG